MFRRMLCLASVFLVFGSSLSAKTFTLGGSRPARLLTPTNAGSGQKIPLLVFLHGYTSSSAQSDNFFAISRQRDTLGFAIVLADGTQNSEGDRFWNATPECCDFEHSGVDDVAYLTGLIREAETLAPIDSKRVYLIGHSNGGFMSYRLACEAPELLRGIISISGAFFKNQALCRNPGAINILQIHGTSDTTVPPDGSDGLPPTQAGLDYWVKRGNCGEVVSAPGSIDLVIAAGAETDSFVWNDCTNATKVGYWKMKGAGHLPFFNANWLKTALKFVE